MFKLWGKPYKIKLNILTYGKSAHVKNRKCVVRIYFQWKTPLLWKAITSMLLNGIR